MNTRLTAEDVKEISSPYLQGGRTQDRWAIKSIELDEAGLTAKVEMTSHYVSPTDNGFHLSIMTALEITAQLMIIYAHHWAGRDRKLREGWMVESQTRSLRAIRSTDDISVSMTIRKMRERGVHLYCIADYVVSDESGGRTEATMKGFLA